MPNMQIEFTVDSATGEAKMKISGIKGRKCVPIHENFTADLVNIVGAEQVVSRDTEEMQQAEQPLRVAEGIRTTR